MRSLRKEDTAAKVGEVGDGEDAPMVILLLSYALLLHPKKLPNKLITQKQSRIKITRLRLRYICLIARKSVEVGRL